MDINILDSLSKGIPFNPLPDHPGIDGSVPHAPGRINHLTDSERRISIKNSLRYFPAELHQVLGKEFLNELEKYGHIYMYRFRPIQYEMKAYPISMYPAKSKQAASIMLMIMNNLDKRVAQFPHELVTYGGNGSVFQNWGQYHLVMKYLSEMTDEQTLSIYSGHPLGLFPSHINAPRAIVTNGMVIPNYSSREDYDKMYAMGVSQYGQMTAGSYCYIGPQGIVHGTTITLLNAGRKYLGLESDLRGKVFVTSGLGGMSGAQAKASVICGAVGIIAEISEAAVKKRHEQGWVNEYYSDLPTLFNRVKKSVNEKEAISIAYLGNVVDLWEGLVKQNDIHVDLGSDQTSLHNPYNGGYYPSGKSFEESNELMVKDPEQFKKLVQESLVRQTNAINSLVTGGMRFWDYGNSFLLEASRAGADIKKEGSVTEFRYPSYVQDIMGDIFSLGFGPFRWVCTSGKESDLAITDRISKEIIEKLRSEKGVDKDVEQQYNDNHLWITQANDHNLVVGSQARILYSDSVGRVEIAVAFNKAVESGEISAPVVISRDHHDVSGTDAPWRETSNVKDGSHFCADMAVQNFCGDSFRGATWVSIHNGGGTGWGEAINGGFGMVLDGTQNTEQKARNMLFWDVNNGISRRSWSYNDNAEKTIKKAMELNSNLKVTIPNHCNEDSLDKIFDK